MKASAHMASAIEIILFNAIWIWIGWQLILEAAK